MVDRRQYTTAVLAALPTLAVGQAADLKVETEAEGAPVRIWLSRCGLADGEPWENTVTLEVYTGRWEISARWNGDDTLECEYRGMTVGRGC